MSLERKERKERKEFVAYLDYRMLNGSLDEIFSSLKELVNENIEKWKKENPQYEVIRNNLEFDIYFNEVNFHLHLFRKETDAEYEKRVKAAKRAKEAREKNVAERKAKKEEEERQAALEAEAKEREEYLRLKAKYES